MLLNIWGMDTSASSSLAWKIPYIEELVTNSPESYSIISITETWVKPHLTDSQLAINGYNIYRCDRLKRERGGCCLYIKDHFTVSDESSFDNDFCEIVSCSIVSIKTLALCIYRPGLVPHKKFQEGLEFMSACIKSVDNSWTILITGDLNLPNINWDSLEVETVPNGCTTCAEDLLQFMEKHFLSQVVDRPTRVARNGTANILDLIITNKVDAIREVDAQQTTLSDHLLVTAILSTDLQAPKLRKKTQNLQNPSVNQNSLCSLNFHKADFDKINEELQNIDWLNLEASCTNEEFPEMFYDTVLQICTKYAPPKSKPKTRKQSKHFKTCYSINRKRRKIMSKLKALISTQPNSDRIQLYRSQLLNLEKEAQEKISRSQEEEEAKTINALKETPQLFYSYAKKKRVSKSRIGPLRKEENGASVFTDDPKDMADLLQKQFISVFSDPLSEKVCIPPNVQSDVTLNEITFDEEEMTKAIDEVKEDSSSGKCGFPPILLKNCKGTLAHPLVLLWKKSMSTGFIHSMFLHQLVTPIYKGKGSRCKASSYRPISLTSHIIKIFERVIRNKLVKFLEDNNKLSSLQHGFRKGRSCLSELLAHYEEIMTNANQGKGTDTVYLDFAKAFDKVDHNILLKKLENIGIGGTLLRWIKAFLSNRQQEVVVDGFSSFIFIVISGIAQGSVLGPILFIIFINDIAKSTKHSAIKCFADDTRISRAISCESDARLLQDDLFRVMKWSIDNNMQLNEDKFEFLKCNYCFDASLLELPFSHYNTCYKTLNGSLIECGDTVKDLGITFSSDLTFNTHIANVIKQANNKSAWILSVFRTRTKHEMLFFYKTYVRSCLEYCCPLWNPSGANSITATKKLEGVQRSFTARIPQLQHLNYWQRLQALNLMSLQRRRERYIILYMWKILTGNAPNDLKITFYSYRDSIKASVPFVPPTRSNTSRFDKSFSVIGPKLWNFLPAECTLTLHSLEKFKEKVDAHILQYPDLPPTAGYFSPHSNSLLDLNLNLLQ